METNSFTKAVSKKKKKSTKGKGHPAIKLNTFKEDKHGNEKRRNFPTDYYVE